jgi:TorA maturation chaperone TorD
MAPTETDTSVSEQQQYRAGAYGYLAALLRQPPDANLLQAVTSLSDVDGTDGDMQASMAMLGLAASSCSLADVRDEHFNLFIGLGRGEVVPYGSWYQTGFLMEKPLGELRDDLRLLGFEKDQSMKEPEDHVAALCEVMAMLITEDAAFDQQAVFFEKHLNRWIRRFFDDLTNAESATFYISVARFGKSFFELESRYLGMSV